MDDPLSTSASVTGCQQEHFAMAGELTRGSES